MAKVNTYQQRTTVNNLGGNTQAQGQRVTSAIGESASKIQQGINDLSQGLEADKFAQLELAKIDQATIEKNRIKEERIKRQEENDAAVWAGPVLSSARLTWTEHISNSKMSAAPGAVGFTPNLLGEFDKFTEETLQKAPTPAAREYLKSRLDSMRTDIGTDAIQFEAGSKVDYRVNQIDETIGNNAKVVQDDPTKFKTVYAETAAVINALEIPPKEKLALLNKAKDTLPYATVLGAIEKNPAASAAKIRSTIPLDGDVGISDLRAKKNLSPSDWGKRRDGSPKGAGYLGVLQADNGKVMTEFSIGVEINGQEIDIPSLVPTLTKSEVKKVLSLKDGEFPPPGIIKKATEFAKSRLDQGLPVFARDGEQGNIQSENGRENFDRVMDVIFKFEGGYNKNDGNGPVNLGVNQHANPDIDVKKLTPQTAKDRVYLPRYWNKIDGDNLPPNVALMAMDTAVNQGVVFAKKILKESGGNVDIMASMRREKYTDIIQSNPSKYGKYGAEWGSRVDKATEQANRMGSSVGTGTHDLSNVNPENIKSSGDSAIDALTFDQRIKLLNHADSLINQSQAVAKEQLRGKLQDFSAMAESGTRIPDGAIPTVQELTEAFGQADGLRMYNDDVKPMLVLNSDMQQLSSLSVNERIAKIKSREPKPGDGFVDQSKRQAIMIQAHQKLLKEMQDDPAAYAVKYAPKLATAYDAIGKSKDPSAAAGAYAVAIIAEQKRLGVLDPVILPKQIADSIVRKFNTQPNGGETAAVMIENQAKVWGDHWPAIYGQLSKDLSPAALVIGSGVNPNASEALARISQLKPNELKEGVDPTVIKDTEAAFNENLVPFMSSVNEVVGGPRTYNVFSEQGKALALFYARSGMSTKDAANKAYQELIGSNYEFVSNSNNKNVMYRVPKGFDPNTVSLQAELSLRKINVNGLVIPRSLFGLDLKQSQSAYKDALINHGYWVTSPKEDGLVLYANGAAVEYTNGKPYIKKWEELKPVANQDGWFGINKGGF